jgi:hypothetical protein
VALSPRLLKHRNRAQYCILSKRPVFHHSCGL